MGNKDSRTKLNVSARAKEQLRATAELNPQAGGPARHSSGSKRGKERNSRTCEPRNQLHRCGTLPSHFMLTTLEVHD